MGVLADIVAFNGVVVALAVHHGHQEDLGPDIGVFGDVLAVLGHGHGLFYRQGTGLEGVGDCIVGRVVCRICAQHAGVVRFDGHGDSHLGDGVIAHARGAAADILLDGIHIGTGL